MHSTHRNGISLLATCALALSLLFVSTAPALADGATPQFSAWDGSVEASALAVNETHCSHSCAAPFQTLNAAEREFLTKELTERIRLSLALDITPYRQALRGHRLRSYDDYALAADLFMRMGAAFRPQIAAAASAITHELDTLFFDHEIELRLVCGKVGYSWQELAALYSVQPKKLTSLVAEAATIEVALDGRTCTVRVSLPAFDALIATRPERERMAMDLARLYFNTIYDTKGYSKEYEHYEPTADYLAELIHPLGGEYLIKDGWYAPRSKATRKHTGTDIKAPRGTAILSVTDGIVVAVGSAAIPGNYVVIRDPLGYEYHYYHMMERSKFVKPGQTVVRGETIGLVGSTGNSDANHLHLGMVSPEKTYINPYLVFLAAGIGPIRVDEAA